MIQRPRSVPTGLLSLAAGLALSAFTQQASATWSILMVDTRTGEIALGSATCVPNINLRSSTPVFILGRGAVTAQSAVDVSGGNRARIFAGFARGMTPDQILDELALNDPGHGNRQYGFIDVDGNALTYSGVDNADWAGGVTGRIDLDPPGPENDIVYSVQGNILTGEPVVLAAESALLNTPGDLAEKLMAGMEAAYSFGGDGRCSCAPNSPTACGSPPDDFIKTADVGYMLVGRLGDRDQGGSFDVLGGAVADVLIGDLDGDGRGDVVTFPSFFGPVVFHGNASGGAGPIVFGELPLGGSITAPKATMLGDVNGDGHQDIVYTTTTQIRVILSNGDGTFEPEVGSPLAGSADAAVLGDFVTGGSPGLEMAALRSGQGRLVTYEFDAAGSAIVAATTQGLPGSLQSSMALTPGGVAIVSASDGVLPYLSDGQGLFTAEPAIATTLGTPSSVLSGDLNGDGITDYVYQYTSSRFAALIDDTKGGHDEIAGVITDPNPETLRDLRLTDIDGDGDDDIAGLIRFGRFSALSFDGANALVASPIRRLLEGTAFGTGDLTGDGLPEIVLAQSSVLGAYANAGSGPPADARGFAGGDYFLELNVPGGPDAGFDDPVEQLRSEFDAWRTDRNGLPDGARSTIAGVPDRVFAAGDSTQVEFTALIRDFAGNLVSGLITGDFEIDAPPGSPVPLQIVSAAEIFGQPGEYEVIAQPTGATGETEMWLRLSGDTPSGDTFTTVVLPAPAYTAAASMADFDNNGLLDLSDIVAFITAFNGGDLAADLDGSGTLDIEDVNLFISEFIAG